MTTSTLLDDLGAAKYVSLTTFRADGTPVATPVWVVRDGEILRILTDPASGKVRRLRANPAVRVSTCDMRGRVKPDAMVVDATVQLDDETGTQRTMKLIEKRYGLMGRILGWLNSRRARKAAGGEIRHIGLRITLG
jgi:PPOX class probable F420-dependent enzyme